MWLSETRTCQSRSRRTALQSGELRVPPTPAATSAAQHPVRPAVVVASSERKGSREAAEVGIFFLVQKRVS